MNKYEIMMEIIITFLKLIKFRVNIVSAKFRKRRLYLTQNIYIPESSFIGPGCRISGSGKEIVIGENSTLVSNVTLNGPIVIGNNVVIASNCTLIARNHDFQKCDALPYGTSYGYKPIIIKNNVWIGSNVSIIPGVVVGEGAIVGLGSVVTHDVPLCACVGGNPAKIIGWRNKDHYFRLVDEQKYLNNIRGSLINQKIWVKRNKKNFKKYLQNRGFMLSSEVIGINSVLKSYVLYQLHLSENGTKFGNAGRLHIVINPFAITDINKTIKEIETKLGENDSIKVNVRQDITDLMESNDEI